MYIYKTEEWKQIEKQDLFKFVLWFFLFLNELFIKQN